MMLKTNSERLLRFHDSYIPEPFSGCWLWNKSSRNGYGQFFVSKLASPPIEYAHRFSYRFLVGEIPTGKSVLHKCDTPLCVNPNHLFIGDDLDNHRDAMSKDRHTRGERHGQAKLTDVTAMNIRTQYRTGEYSQSYLANQYGVSVTLICAVVNNRRWKHVAA